jgi:hypothetical protein
MAFGIGAGIGGREIARCALLFLTRRRSVPVAQVGNVQEWLDRRVRRCGGQIISINQRLRARSALYPCHNISRV